MGYLIIIFIIIIAFFIYVLWGQHDDFSFFVVFLLLTCTLYVLAIPPKQLHEAFTEVSDTNLDLDAYKKLSTLYSDVTQLIEPKFQYIIAGFRGDAKPSDEQKYDSAGNMVEDIVPDEVPVDNATEVETRLLNRFLKDLHNFDPGAYYRLLSLATGKNNLIKDEFPL